MLRKFQAWKKSQDLNTLSLSERKDQVKQHPVPEHIAIIMDGNGRWAQKRALPRMMGHHESSASCDQTGQ